MKTSAVLASLLFGSFAVAAPVDKRALIYKTEVVVETVVVYTTVWDDEAVPEATTTPAGNFYEQPPQPSSAAAPTPEQKTSSVAPPQAPTPPPAPAPSAAPSPSPAPSPAPEQPKPVEEPKPSSAAYVTPAPSPAAYVAPAPSPAAPAPSPAAPAPSSAAPAAAPAASSIAPAPYTPPSTGGTTSGEQFSNVDITIFDNDGGRGACGIEQYDTDMVAAIAEHAWGKSTWDVMTGKPTNPWCGQRIKVEYEGKFVEVTITDMCPKCVGYDIDLSVKAWKDLTGKDEKTRRKASWSKIA